MSDAIVIAGAVAKGAFEAGACAELFSPEVTRQLSLDVRRIVGVSSGALNAALLGAHIRDGSASAGASLLEQTWIEDAGLTHILAIQISRLTNLRGLSTTAKLRELVKQFVQPRTGTRPIELAVVVTDLGGNVASVGSARRTTFERCLQFDGAVYDTATTLQPLIDAVVASAAFPGLFEPADITVDGRVTSCVDGGAVNNSPLKWATTAASDIDRVFVISPQPAVIHEPSSLSGVSLVSYLAEILIQERLFRDLQTAYDVNEALLALERRLPDAEVRAGVLADIGWTGRRFLSIVEVRPESPLAGNEFTGFLSKDLRASYVDAGHAAVRRTLGIA